MLAALGADLSGRARLVVLARQAPHHVVVFAELERQDVGPVQTTFQIHNLAK